MVLKIGKIKRLSKYILLGKIKKINLPKNLFVKLKAIIGINNL